MKNYKQAFTLIELLVVVLIIGILSAVALPQYQKAVEKTKFTQALTLLNSLAQAAEVYLITNGEWPQKLTDLDVQLPADYNKKTQAFLNNATVDALANDEWSVEIDVGANRNQKALVITRLTGLYRGCFFRYVYSDRDYLQRAIMCGELKGAHLTSYKFNQTQGSCCEKLFHGTYTGGQDVSQYSLP